AWHRYASLPVLCPAAACTDAVVALNFGGYHSVALEDYSVEVHGQLPSVDSLRRAAIPVRLLLVQSDRQLSYRQGKKSPRLAVPGRAGGLASSVHQLPSVAAGYGRSRLRVAGEPARAPDGAPESTLHVRAGSHGRHRHGAPVQSRVNGAASAAP